MVSVRWLKQHVSSTQKISTSFYIKNSGLKRLLHFALSKSDSVKILQMTVYDTIMTHPVNEDIDVITTHSIRVVVIQ